MNLKLTGLGASPKKLILLAALMAVAAYFYFSNGAPSSGPASASVQRPSGTFGPGSMPRAAARPGMRAARGAGKSIRSAGEFKPSLKIKDENFDPSGVDPTLRLDLLAKLKNVKIEGGGRSVFAFGEAAPAVVAAKEPDKIIPKGREPIGPRQPKEVAAAAPPPPPPPPPVPLKFYGFVSQTKAGVKSAFFLDGDDILLGTEGQLIKNRYKVVKIGVNSAIVEDTQFKNHQTTLPLVEELTG